MNPSIKNAPVWHSAVDGIEAAALAVDPHKDRMLAVNAAASSMLEASPELLMNLRPSSLFHEHLPRLVAITDECLAKGTSWSDVLDVAIPGTARTFDVELFASRFEHEGSTVMLLMLYRLDSTRTRRAKAEYERLRKTDNETARLAGIERVFRDLEYGNQLLLNAAGEGIYGINAKGETTFLNPAAERMLGWKSEELIGVAAHQTMHHSHEDGEAYALTKCPIYAAFREGAVQRVTNEVFWRRDGTSFPVEYTSTPIEDNGRLIGAVVVFRDVSEQRTSERKLRDALAKVEGLTERLEKENAYLQDEILSDRQFGEIVGDSEPVRNVIRKIELVSPTDASVLVTGESGTGKELIAHAIHSASRRKSRPLIKVNCAAIPRELFESEFFGHRKGAFTGAIADRAGRFEMADGGTIFLDEISELPLDMQGKLLRALQEGQFERVGEAKTIASDFRVIAASNRDLKQEVREKRFREDLYFRIAVFPVEAVALRDRSDDIPLLVQHFVRTAAPKLNLPVKSCTIADMERLQAYPWPGNIRELRNVVEHAMIVSRDEKLRFPLLDSSGWTDADIVEPMKPKTPNVVMTAAEIRDVERQNIIRALKVSGGRVSGIGAAADLLGIKPPTLYSRIKRLGIDAAKLKH